MSVYFDKARELADLLLASECSLRLCDADAAYHANATSLAKMEAYKAYQSDVQAQMEAGGLTKHEWDVLQHESAKRLADLRKDPPLADLLAAEKDFAQLVDQVTAIIRSVLGEEDSACNASHCQGCKKGGSHA